MDPLFQLVGCVVASRPAAELIDAFVLQARRERAAVMARSAQGATFVRFNASDLRLVALACRTLRDAAGPPLRFAFAVGHKDGSAGPEGMDIGTRSLEQAQAIAAAARDGQVLVAPQLTGPLVEAGYTLRSQPLRRRGADPLAAFLVELEPGNGDEGPADAAPTPATGRASLDFETGTPDAALRMLTVQLDSMARRQIELEWRQQQLLGTLGRVDRARVPGRSWDQLLADLELQMGRVQARLGTIDGSERRLETLQLQLQALDKALGEQLPKLGEIDRLRQQCDAVVEQLAQAQHTLAAVATLQQQLPPVADQMARHEQRLAALDQGSDAVEQKLQSLAQRDAALQTALADLAAVESISRSCRDDLLWLADRRGELDALRGQVEQLSDRAAHTERQIADIDARRPGVDAVAQRAASVTHLLGDIDLHLERLSEQREVIDQVGERLARLDFTMADAQNTLHALQRERDVAERIEQSLKALRARTAARPAV